MPGSKVLCSERKGGGLIEFAGESVLVCGVRDLERVGEGVRVAGLRGRGLGVRVQGSTNGPSWGSPSGNL